MSAPDTGRNFCRLQVRAAYRAKEDDGGCASAPGHGRPAPDAALRADGRRIVQHRCNNVATSSRLTVTAARGAMAS